ncbi:MAG TPA: hypothetical protein VFG74_03210 [Miltoncostaeaceae bacterium]|nr:hypothetical protein [Miltoncostaeaceae bacterium]
MNGVTAAAVRRGTIAAGALGVTVAAHVMSGADARVLPVAPALWLTIVAIAVLPGFARRDGRPFAAWGPVRLAWTLVAGQFGAHAVLSGAPWALGLVEGHRHGPWLTPAAVGVHLAAALVLTVALTLGERWVVRALGAIARAMAPAPRPGRPRPLEIMRAERRAPRSRVPAGTRSSRGPPGRRLRTA